MAATIWPDLSLYDHDHGGSTGIVKSSSSAINRITETQKSYADLSPTIFTDNVSKPMHIQVGSANASGFTTQMLETDESVDNYLDACRRDVPSTTDPLPAGQFILLRPSFGWGHLMIREAAMTKILRHHCVFPQFFKYLKAFGEKGFAKDEGYAGYDCVTNYHERKVASIETCFLWKYVEPGNAAGRFEWSIRQALVYQKYDPHNRRSVNILVRVPGQVASRLKSALTSGSESNEDILGAYYGVQMACASSGVDNWREFLNHLDAELTGLFDDLIMSNVEPGTFSDVDQVANCLASMKQLQILIDQMIRARHMLDLNDATMKAMLRAATRQSDTLPFQNTLEDIREEYGFLQKMAQSLIDRAKMLSHELRDTIALRNHEINNKTADVTGQGTKAMVQLAHKSVYESRVVKVLTIVAAVFIPASFAADFLQMGYVSVRTNSNFDVQAERGILLWVILAVPLVVATLLICAVCELVVKRSSVKEHIFVQDEKHLSV